MSYHGQTEFPEREPSPVEKTGQRDRALARVIAGRSSDLDALDGRFLATQRGELQGDTGERFIRELDKTISSGAHEVDETFRRYITAGIIDSGGQSYAMETERLRMYTREVLSPGSRVRLPAPAAPQYEPHAALYDHLRTIRFRADCVTEVYKQREARYVPGVPGRVDCSTAAATAATELVADEVYWQRIKELMAMSSEERRSQEYWLGISAKELALGMSRPVRPLVADMIDQVPHKQWKLSGEKRGPKERQQAKWRRLVAAVVLTSVGAGAGFGYDDLSAFWRPQPEAAAPANVPEKVKEGVCLTEEANRLLETDCNVLPDVLEGANFSAIDSSEYYREKMKATDRRLLIAAVKDGKLSKSQLSSDYEAAMRTALEDPFAHYVNVNLDVPMQVYQNPNEFEENAEYSPRDNDIRFFFITDQDRYDKTLFPTWGSLRAVLVHESAHAVFEKWYNDADHDKITKKNVQTLTKICVADLKDSLRDTAVQHGDEIVERLNELSDLLESQPHRLQASSRQALLGEIEIMKSKLADKSGDTWADDHISVNPMFMGCGTWDADIDLQISLSTKDTKKFLDTYPKDQEHMTGNERFGTKLRDIFGGIAALQSDTVFSTMEYTTEGAVSKGLMSKDAGHPDNLTERVASTLALVQTTPHEYAQYINALGATRKKNEVDFLGALSKQLGHQSKSLVAETNLQYVLSLIS